MGLSCPAKLGKNIVRTLECRVSISSEHRAHPKMFSQGISRSMTSSEVIALYKKITKFKVINKMGDVTRDTGG